MLDANKRYYGVSIDMMTYDEAMEWLNSARYSEFLLGLESVNAMLHALGDPHKGMKYVHVAGTNGKGSTSAMIAKVLQESGYKVGLYTSPFVERFTERIAINGEEISEADVARLTEPIKDYTLSLPEDSKIVPTVFEMITALAFMYFKEKQVDICVLEVGMGGRLDATNAIECPEVSVITSIDFDHMDFLGHTYAEIAGEKAGIIKDNSSVVSYPQEASASAVIKAKAEEKNCSFVEVSLENIHSITNTIKGQTFSYLRTGYDKPEEFSIRLLGEHQLANTSVAIEALEVLRRKGFAITDETMKRGLANTYWPGRLEVVCDDPITIVDAAHNPQGARALGKSLKTLFGEQKLNFVMGVLADKDYRDMLNSVEPMAKRFFTVTPDSHRALSAEELASIIRADGIEADSFPSVVEAVEAALEKCPGEPLCVFGSLYYIGQVTSFFKKRSK